MPISIDQRIAALTKSGFKISKDRVLKSGMKYKVKAPKAFTNMYPVYYTITGLENVVAYAEGMATVWSIVQRERGERRQRYRGGVWGGGG